MQIIVNFLQIISEAVSSFLSFFREDLSSLAYLAEWLNAARDVVGNIVVWMPIAARNTLYAAFGFYLMMRLFGRD